MNISDIRSARSRIAPDVHRTPVLTSRMIDEQTGARVFFKCENFQKIGAFKARGAHNAVFSLTEDEGRCGVVTHSSGNDVPDLDVLLIPVGGGGLLNGSAIAAKAIKSDIRVIAAEPAGTDDAFRSFKAGQLILTEEAAMVVATKYLARPDSQTAAICGAGTQGEIQLRALGPILPLQRALIWSPSNATASALAERMTSEFAIDVQPTRDLGQSTRRSDVIATCTPASRWILGHEHVPAGAFVAPSGADSPGKREIEPELLASRAIVCDLTEQCAHVGDLHRTRAMDLMTVHRIRGEFGSVVMVKVHGRIDDREIVIFDSTGTALQDAATAAVVYQRTLERGAMSRFRFCE